MTSRLKRKIELSQRDPSHQSSSSSSQPYGNLSESFVSVGTALPSLIDPKKKDLNEFKPAWEQEVLDEQGRRRFHGAFTGGFSAGYFNSVGSKEGAFAFSPSEARGGFCEV
jgi:G patch domain-containing protein 1